MVGYIIGLVLGIIVYVIQNLKPTSFWFRVSFLLFTIAFVWGISYVGLGYWNILLIPTGVLVLCFIAAFCFPYSGTSAKNEYMSINGQDFYSKLQDDDVIGEISVRGFKQTYDRIIAGIVTKITEKSSIKDYQTFLTLLYSKNFYPISTHTKGDIMQHINSVIEEVASKAKRGWMIEMTARDNVGLLFNAYISVMYIHEEATKEIEKIKNQGVIRVEE